VTAANWRTPISGDVLDCGRPTGPLWGRGRSPAACEAAAVERSALEQHRSICDGLEHAGLRQDRRPLVLEAGNLAWFRDGLHLALDFSLPGGGYATSFLAEVFDLREPAGSELR
jgi:tRNA pseudouridine13 synthase